MKSSLSFLLFLLSCSFFFSTPVPASQWADPTGFLEEERIERRVLSPGVTWIAVSGKLHGQPLQTHIIAADLARPELSLKSLVGNRFVNADTGQFFRRSSTSQLLTDSEALAAINVSFFDIRATQAPEGLTLQGGKVLREPASGRPNLIYLKDGRTALADLGWKAQVRLGDQRRPVLGVNRPALGGDEVVLYLPPWSRSPGTSATFTQGQKVREILVQETSFEPAPNAAGRSRLIGKIVEIRESLTSVEIEGDQFVLTASESAAPFFRNAKVGGEVEVNWELTAAPPGVKWHEVREAVSAGPFLVRGGEAVRGGGAFWDNRHPRSAIGISPDGRQLMFVLVDGRSAESVGISLGDLADYLIHLGADEAMNFDGGGSSGLAARVDEKDRLLNTPSDGRERFVPTGLGIVVTEQNLNQPRVWTGKNGRTMTGLFESYDAAADQVTLILEGRRLTLPLSSLSSFDQTLISRASPAKD